jgi:MFS family permease
VQQKNHTHLKYPFFYGWVLVFAGSVNSAFVLGGGQFAASTFLVPMQDELGWSRTMLFGAFSLRGLLGGFMEAAVGPLGDRRLAPRFVLPLGVLLLGLSYLAVKWVHSPWEYYFWYGFVGSLGLSLTGYNLWEAVILKWFVQKRTKALTWNSAGQAAGPMIFPVALTALILTVGWRDAWLWFGIGTICLLLPLSLMVRTRPEDVGQFIDGAESEASLLHASTNTNMNQHSFTRPEALRNRNFWLLTIGGMIAVIGLTGYQSHWIPYFLDIGFSAGVAAVAVSTYGIMNIASRFIWGSLASRYPLRILITIEAALAALGVIFLIFIGNPYMLFIWAIYQGVNLAGYFQLQAMITVQYFGRDHIGAIRGFMMPFANVMRASAPLFLGAMRDWRGNYSLAFILVAFTWLVGGLLVFASRHPVDPTGEHNEN